MNDLFAPDQAGGTTPEDVGRFLSNIQKEVAAGFLSGPESERMLDAKSGHGVLLKYPEYWHRAYDRPFARAVGWVEALFPSPRVLDIACGTGTQALYLALSGAQVLALDSETLPLQVLRRRLRFYEEQQGRDIDLTMVRADARRLPLRGKFDVIYSHAGWTAVAAIHELLDASRDLLSPGGLVILKFSNTANWAARAKGRSSFEPSPSSVREASGAAGFKVLDLWGTTAAPKQLWSTAAALAGLVDRILLRFESTWLHGSAVLQLLDPPK